MHTVYHAELRSLREGDALLKHSFTNCLPVDYTTTDSLWQILEQFSWVVLLGAKMSNWKQLGFPKVATCFSNNHQDVNVNYRPNGTYNIQTKPNILFTLNSVTPRRRRFPDARRVLRVNLNLFFTHCMTAVHCPRIRKEKKTHKTFVCTKWGNTKIHMLWCNTGIR